MFKFLKQRQAVTQEAPKPIEDNRAYLTDIRTTGRMCVLTFVRKGQVVQIETYLTMEAD